MKEIAPYGTWKSPVTAAEAASEHARLSFPAMAGDEVWWQEKRPAEGGRTTVMARAVANGVAGRIRELLPTQYNVRTRVHEYGGQSFLPVPNTSGSPFDLVFASLTDQRLYRVATETGAAEPIEPTPLTPEPEVPAGLRYADMVLSPHGREIVCVREAQDADGAITRAIVAVPLDGSAAADPAAVRVLVTGAHFFAYPAPSPDGSRLAWISWDHPRMPWDGTELRVGPASGTTVASSELVMGGPAESVLAPAWAGADALYAVSDASGWWNLYQVTAAEGAVPRPLCPREEEFSGTLWQIGRRPYAMLGDGRLAVLHGLGALRLGFLDVTSGTLTDAELPGYQVFQGPIAVPSSGEWVAVTAGGPAARWAMLRVAVHGGTPEVLSEEPRVAFDPAYLPVPRQVSLSDGPDSAVVHAIVYPPASPVAAGPPGELPPYIVWAHSGPTSLALPVLDVEKAYFTSRGIGVIDVNYGGSAGYGRGYRQRLAGHWGVVDVADALHAALALAAAGEADRARLGIRGHSAGGWTALAAVTSGLATNEPVFAAAVSYYGVSDLKPFAATTHDFESRYLDGLLGPLPAATAVYDERSPVGHVTSGTCPILILQGMDDPIVPPAQSDTIARDLAAHGTPYAYLKFPGESHGFRMAESNITALEAELAFYGQIMGFIPPGVPPVALE
jgi:dipeptidyl aminopeptidase/acylaminoacyl peptidase